MLRIELVDTGVSLDTRDVSLQLNFSESDIKQYAKPVAAHSLTFRLPFSEVNNDQLGYLDVVDASSETRIEYPVRVYEDDKVVLHGNLGVRSADLQARTYDCVIYSNVAGIWQTLKASRWQDVFTDSDGNVTTDLDHDHNGENINKSQAASNNDITQGDVGDDIIWYPVSIAPMYHQSGDGPNLYPARTEIVATSDYRLYVKDQVPSIQVKYLLQQLFLHCGYTLDVSTDNLFTGSYPLLDKLYYQLVYANLKYRPYFGFRVTPSAIFGFDASVWTQNSLPNSPQYNWPLLSGPTAADDYDPDGHTGGAFGMIQPPTTGTWFYRVTMGYSFSGSPTTGHSVGVRIMRSNWQFQDGYVIQSQELAGASYTAVVDIAVNHDAAGLYYAFVLLHTLPSGATQINYDYTLFKVELVSYIGDSPRLQIPSCFGKETADKFLAAIMTQYNLVLTINEEAKTCAFSERQKFYERDVANAKDWTEKVDRSQSMVVTNNLDVLDKELVFYHEEGQDGKSVYAQEVQFYRHTNFTHRSGLKLAVGKQEVGGYFSPVRYGRVLVDATQPTTDGLMPRLPYTIIRKEGDEFEVAHSKNPQLHYKGGVFLTDNSVTAPKVFDSLETSQSSFTILSRITTSTPSAPNTYMSWTSKTAWDGIGVNGRKSLYERCYQEEVRLKYDKDARMLTCTMYLTPQDIADLGYDDLIMIDGTYYHFVDIQNYVVGQRSMCKVRLRKMLNPKGVGTGSVSCSEIFVGSISAGGVVQFEDRQGNDVDGSEACCIYYGGGEWEWDAETGTCRTGDTESEPDVYDPETALRAVPMPVSTTEYAPEQVVTYEPQDGNYTQQIDFSLRAKTTKTTNTKSARNGLGTEKFRMPMDCVAGLHVTYMARSVAGANVGAMEFGEFDCVFRVEDNQIEKTGNDSDIARSGDASSVSMALSVSYADGVPFFSLDCTGHNLSDFDWQVDITMRLQPILVDISEAFDSITMQDGTHAVTEAENLLLTE